MDKDFFEGIHDFMRVGDPAGVLVQLSEVPVREPSVDDQQGDDPGEAEDHTPSESAVVHGVYTLRGSGVPRLALSR